MIILCQALLGKIKSKNKIYLKKMKVYEHKELKPKRDGHEHSDPCRVPTLRKYKDLKYIQKVKSSCSKRKV